MSVVTGRCICRCLNSVVVIWTLCPNATLHRRRPQRVRRANSAAKGRLARIAKALASGANRHRHRSSAEGISRTIASRNANSPECRQLIAEIVSSEHDEMRAMFYRCARVIEQALSARREYTTKDGQILDGGPDHYARLAATKHFRDFITLGRPEPKQLENQERKTLTLDELRRIVEDNATAPPAAA